MLSFRSRDIFDTIINQSSLLALFCLSFLDKKMIRVWEDSIRAYLPIVAGLQPDVQECGYGQGAQNEDPDVSHCLPNSVRMRTEWKMILTNSLFGTFYKHSLEVNLTTSQRLLYSW